jgi:ABC-type nitrate/sulfonate/bicarbonate transport system substrate-binding protein
VKKILILAIFFTVLIAQPLEKVKLQLQWKHQFEFAGFYVAKEKGYYKDIGFDVEFGSKDIVDEVLNSNATYGLTYSTLVLDYMQDKPVVLLANFLKHSHLVLVTQKGIQSPNEMATIKETKDKRYIFC